MRVWPYRITVIVAATLLGYLSVVVTLANAAAVQSPGLALRLWPGHALAEARAADQVIAANPGAPAIRQAADHATRALRRNPMLPSAARTVAMRALLARNERRGAALFEYAAAMSKRDIPTQFWLLERRVQANDVRGALVHFGIALRVSTATRDILFPVLTSALSEPHLVRPIAELVRGGTEWTSPFLYHVAERSADPRHAAALYLALGSLGSTPAREHLEPLIGRLTTARQYEAAVRLYRLIDPRWRLGDANAQLDGTFSRPDAPPFGWTLNGGNAWLGAAPDNSNRVLYLSGDAGGEEWMARRLLLLPAGRYAIDGRYGVSGRPQGAIEIAVTCLNLQESSTSASIPLTAESGRFRHSIEVPGGCSAQWFSIALGDDRSTDGATVWIDDLSSQRWLIRQARPVAANSPRGADGHGLKRRAGRA